MLKEKDISNRDKVAGQRFYVLFSTFNALSFICLADSFHKFLKHWMIDRELRKNGALWAKKSPTASVGHTNGTKIYVNQTKSARGGGKADND